MERHKPAPMWALPSQMPRRAHALTAKPEFAATATPPQTDWTLMYEVTPTRVWTPATTASTIGLIGATTD
jgi:hypothetical protein